MIGSDAYESWAAGHPCEAQALYADIPAAVVVPARHGLEVVCCPFCSERHYHSPGYGTRYSHCGAREYVLVPPYGDTVDRARRSS